MDFCVLLNVILSGFFCPQAERPLFACGFETEEETLAWRTFRSSERLVLVRRSEHPADVKQGEGAACLAFTPSKSRLPSVFRDLDPLGPVGSVDLWIKVERGTQIGLALKVTSPTAEGEQNKTLTYSVLFYVPGGRWTRATIPMEDFLLDGAGSGASAKPDPKGIRGVAITDTLALLAASDADSASYLADHTLPQRVFLDEFRMLEAGPVERSGAPGTLDAFERNYLAWLPLRGVEIERTEMPGASSGYGLRVAYNRGEGPICSVIRSLPKRLQGSWLCFLVRASEPMRLQVTLEEADGSQWYRTVDVSEESRLVELRLEDFRSSKLGKQPSVLLQADRLAKLAFTDPNTTPGKAWFQVGEIRLR